MAIKSGGRLGETIDRIIAKMPVRGRLWPGVCFFQLSGGRGYQAIGIYTGNPQIVTFGQAEDVTIEGAALNLLDSIERRG